MLPRFRRFWRELRRRRVVHAVGIFLAGGWLILQILDVLLGEVGIPPWSMKFVVWLLSIGFPVVLVLSWRYDMTWDGLKLTPPAEVTPNLDLSLKRKDYLIITLLGLAMFLVSISLTRIVNKEVELANAAPALPNSIAVLPFENMSQNREEDYFGRGLAEDILHRLASIRELRVASRTSAFELDTDNLSMEAIGERLGVEAVLEGSFRKEGNRVRIVAQLIDTKTGYHALSLSYDRNLDDLFGIYDEISSAVVSELQLAIVPDSLIIAKPPTDDMQAYDYFLQARSILQRASHAESAANAQQFFARAVEQDPAFAGAWSGQCQAYLSWHFFEPNPAHLEAADESCQRALKLAPDLLETHVAMGDLHRNTGRYHLAVTEYQTALKGDARLAMAWRGIGQAYAATGKSAEAENAMLKAVELDPDDLANLQVLGYFYFSVGQFENAANAYDRVATHPKAGPSAFNGLGASHYMLGDFDQAAEAYRRVIESEPTAAAYSNIAGMYYYDGRFEDAVIMYREAVALAPDDPVFWGNLGDGLREIPDGQEEALQVYTRAAGLTQKLLQSDPENAELLTNLAHYYSRMGEDQRALEYLQYVLTTAPDDVYAHYYASLVHLEAGRIEQSCEEIARSMALGYPPVLLKSDPQFAQIRNNPEFIELLSESD